MTKKGGKRTAYQKEYWSTYKTQKKRIQPRISLTESEYKLFNQLATDENISISKLIKNMAIAYEQESFLLPSTHLEKIEDFVYLVRNIANNINQIAHHSNSIKSVVNEGRIFEHLKSLEDEFKKFISQPYANKGR
jgi:hypothetical protein